MVIWLGRATAYIIGGIIWRSHRSQQEKLLSLIQSLRCWAGSISVRKIRTGFCIKSMCCGSLGGCARGKNSSKDRPIPLEQAFCKAFTFFRGRYLSNRKAFLAYFKLPAAICSLLSSFLVRAFSSKKKWHERKSRHINHVYLDGIHILDIEDESVTSKTICTKYSFSKFKISLNLKTTGRIMQCGCLCQSWFGISTMRIRFSISHCFKSWEKENRSYTSLWGSQCCISLSSNWNCGRQTHVNVALFVHCWVVRLSYTWKHLTSD